MGYMLMLGGLASSKKQIDLGFQVKYIVETGAFPKIVCMVSIKEWYPFQRWWIIDISDS